MEGARPRLIETPRKSGCKRIKEMEVRMSLHEELKDLFEQYTALETVIIEKLQQAEKQRLYKKFGYRSLFRYVMGEFGIAENQALLFINVARTCTEVPELKMAISNGDLNVSKAKRILSVVEKAPELWIEKAKTLSQKQVEREVAKEKPQTLIIERIRPVAENLAEFKCGINRDEEELVIRCRELASQSLGRQATLRETLRFMANDCLEKRDPIRKAKRTAERKNRNTPKTFENRKKVLSSRRVNLRTPIPAAIKHQVVLRDLDQCQHREKDGTQCSERQWTQTHHIIEVAQGGTNALENLTTLCSFHHDMQHGFQSRKYAKAKISECFVGWAAFA
jgi:hypothetical protein